jgi:hypothetical protein
MMSYTRIEKCVEGSVGGLIEVLLQHFPGETYENKKNLIHVAWCFDQDSSRTPPRKIRKLITRTDLLIKSYALLKGLLENRGWK